MTASVMVLAFVIAQSIAGCGDDDGGFKPQDPFRPLTSPENLLHNLQTCYNMRDFEHFVPLLHEAFTFHFDEEALGEPGVPDDGLWGKSEELQVTYNMFDTTYVPSDPKNKIHSLKMSLSLSGPLQETNLQGDPPGTLEGYATLDLTVETVGAVMYLVPSSRPLFYFSPDSTVTPVTWKLWRVVDAGFEGAAATAGWESRWTSRPHETPTPVEKTSWGEIKALYVESFAGLTRASQR